MSRPSLTDRALKRAVPRPVADHAPLPHAIDHGLWALDRQFAHFGGARMPSRSSIVRLGSGDLALVSPPPLLDAPTRDAIAELGAVRHVVIPNPFHYLYAAEVMGHYPEAQLLAAPGVRERVPALDFAEELGPDAPPAWAGALEYVILGPVRGLSEILLFHRTSGTLILTDVAFNITHYARPLDRIVWRMSGIPAALGPGRTSRSLLLRDEALARRCLERALEWPIRRVLVAHGETVEDRAADRLRAAFSRYVDAEAP